MKQYEKWKTLDDKNGVQRVVLAQAGTLETILYDSPML